MNIKRVFHRPADDGVDYLKSLGLSEDDLRIYDPNDVCYDLDVTGLRRSLRDEFDDEEDNGRSDFIMSLFHTMAFHNGIIAEDPFANKVTTKGNIKRKFHRDSKNGANYRRPLNVAKVHDTEVLTNMEPVEPEDLLSGMEIDDMDKSHTMTEQTSIAAKSPVVEKVSTKRNIKRVFCGSTTNKDKRIIHAVKNSIAKRDYNRMLKAYENRELTDLELSELNRLLIEIEDADINIDTTKYRTMIADASIKAARLSLNNRYDEFDFTKKMAKNIAEKIFTNEDEYKSDSFIQENLDTIKYLISLEMAKKPPNVMVDESKILQELEFERNNRLAGWNLDDFNAPSVEINNEMITLANEIIAFIRPKMNEGVGSTSISVMDAELVEDRILEYARLNNKNDEWKEMTFLMVQEILAEMDIKDGEDFDDQVSYAAQLKEEEEFFAANPQVKEMVDKARQQYEPTKDEQAFVESLYQQYKVDQIANHNEALIRVEAMGLPPQAVRPLTEEGLRAQFKLVWQREVRNFLDSQQQGFQYVPTYVNNVNGFRTEPFNPFDDGQPGALARFMDKYFYKESFYVAQMTKYGVGDQVAKPSMDFFKLEKAETGLTQYKFINFKIPVPTNEYEDVENEDGTKTRLHQVRFMDIPIYKKPIEGLEIDPNLPAINYYDYERVARQEQRAARRKSLKLLRVAWGNTDLYEGKTQADFSDDELLELIEAYEDQMFSLDLYNQTLLEDSSNTQSVTWNTQPKYEPIQLVHTGNGILADIDATISRFVTVPEGPRYKAKRERRKKLIATCINRSYTYARAEGRIEEAIDEIVGIKAPTKERDDIRDKLRSVYNISTGNYEVPTAPINGVNMDRFKGAIHIINGTKKGIDIQGRIELLREYIIKGAIAMNPTLQEYAKAARALPTMTFAEMMAAKGKDTSKLKKSEPNHPGNTGARISISEELTRLAHERRM